MDVKPDRSLGMEPLSDVEERSLGRMSVGVGEKLLVRRAYSV